MKCVIKEGRTPFLSSKPFGLFFEDINYAADGGLYAEMLENRQFAFRQAENGEQEKTYVTRYAGDYGWKKYPENTAAEMCFLEGEGVSRNNPHYMSFQVKEEEAGFTNKAYDGITMSKGSGYQVILWMRCPEYQGDIEVRIVDKEEKRQVAGGKISVSANAEWKLYALDIEAKEDVQRGLFVVRQGQGTVDYGYISMMPKDAVAGIFRKDLFELLKDLKPGFLRFPGGCIVEGATLANRYQWKDTVGVVWDRKWNWSRWAVHDVTMGTGEPLYFPFYNQSYGIGFYEYFLLCDLLGAKPLPVLSVGLACQFQSDELVPIDSEEFQAYLQDALDLIEFANGDATTKWGKLRCEMGHEEPFGLEYLGIGNEQWETEKVDFFARYTAFEKAVHEVYPEIQLIGSAGPDVTTERYTAAWDFYKKNAGKNAAGEPEFTVAVDEHYYMPPQWFYENVNMYDSYSRDIPVFAGEYAAHCEKKENSHEAAMAEAAFMCGLERNGDVIRFASVAPLFARVGYEQWKPDFIWFDDARSMGTPGYYVQKLFSCYTGTESCEYELQGAEEKLYTAVSADQQAYYVKLINAGEQEIQLESLTMESGLVKTAQLVQMKGESMKAENTLDNPKNIALEELGEVELPLVLPALSCSVLVIKK